MSDLGGILATLKKERDRLNRAIAALSGVAGSGKSTTKRTLSAAARERISAAQKARWAKLKKKKAA
jgi:Mrp family chromosome partitioning ATPase